MSLNGHPTYAFYSKEADKPYRAYENMTPEIRAQVCTCQYTGKPMWLPADTDGTGYELCVCSKCRKPESFHIHGCNVCDEIFVKDFYAWFCYENPICWDCVQEEEEPCNHLKSVCKQPNRKSWVAPILPKPTVYSKQDLDDFMLELGI